MMEGSRPDRAGRAPAVDGTTPFDGQDRHSEIFFAAVETTRMPMIVTDPRRPDNPIIFANRAFEQMTGYASSEIIDTNCRFLQGPETDRQTIADLRQAIDNEAEIAVEILNYRKDGSTFWNALFISPVRDREGRLLYFFGSQLDVSRRRDAEEALRQAQKMEALGQLTGGIAHDFNNLLQVITGYHELVLQGLGKPDLDRSRLTRSVRNAVSATDRAATLTQQLLAFARKQRLEGRTINLNAVVDGMHALLARTLGDHVRSEIVLADDLWNCRVDPSHCEVALLAILINARDALVGRADATVRIVTANVDIGADDPESGSALRSGRHASIAISDNGSGMAPEILARVTEPFFTTKEEGQGTGLGLSTVYGFARQSGGMLRLRSDEGSGTTVTLLFPAREEEEVRPGPERMPRAVDRSRDELILVVDDRAEVSELAEEFLAGAGYRVKTAPNARTALEVLESGASDPATRIDLLFSDLIMPGGMNGVVLAREARRRHPRLKVLLTTGYAEASIEREGVGGTEFEVIDKPYRRVDLLRRVRLVLDGPTGID